MYQHARTHNDHVIALTSLPTWDRITDIERRSHNSYTAPCNGGVSHGAPIGGIRLFLPTTHAETNANKMHPQSLWVVIRFTCVYLHAQTAVHTHLTNHGYFDSGKKPEYLQFEPYAGIKMAQVLRFPVYICGLYTLKTKWVFFFLYCFI